MKGFKFTFIFGFFVILFLALIVINPFKPKKYTIFGFKKDVSIVGFKIGGHLLEKKEDRWWVIEPWKDWADESLVVNFLRFLKTQTLMKIQLKEKLSEKEALKLEVFLENKGSVHLMLFQQTSMDERVFVKKEGEFFLGSHVWEKFFKVLFWIQMDLGLPSSEPKRMVYKKEGVVRVLTRPKQGWASSTKKVLQLINSIKVKKLIKLQSDGFKKAQMALELYYDPQKKPWKLSFFKDRSSYFIFVNKRNSLFQIEKLSFEDILKKVP